VIRSCVFLVPQISAAWNWKLHVPSSTSYFSAWSATNKYSDGQCRLNACKEYGVLKPMAPTDRNGWWMKRRYRSSAFLYAMEPKAACINMVDAYVSGRPDLVPAVSFSRVRIFGLWRSVLVLQLVWLLIRSDGLRHDRLCVIHKSSNGDLIERSCNCYLFVNIVMLRKFAL
jgi:hypothetical protein